MAGREQIAIVRHVPLSVLNKRIKHPKGLPQVVPAPRVYSATV